MTRVESQRHSKKKVCLFVCLFVCLLINVLFNYGVIISDYTAPKCRMITK
jgi:hypothetical protein